MRIPFCPLPVNRAKVVSRKFYGIAEPIVKMSPGLKLELAQAEISLAEREYIGIVIFSSLFMSLMTFLPLLIVSMAVSPEKGAAVSLSASLFLFLVTFMYLKKYPKLIVTKKVKDLERNLLYALRHIYVQVKAGVPVFDCLVSVATKNYGYASIEFKKAIDQVSSGVSIETALEELALNNPSLYFRRSVWQISNGLKAGSDIGSILKNIIENISSEQKIGIRRYGSQLNPLTLVYMMIAVIMPSLGVTFLIVLSAFSGLSVGQNMFWAILVFLIVFQFMFLGIIRSRRPNII